MSENSRITLPANELPARISRYLKRFSNPRRLQIIYLLLEKGPLCVSELVELTAIPQGRLSAHLSYLRRCRDIGVTRRDNFVYYSVVDERVADFLNLVRTLVECNCTSQCFTCSDDQEDDSE